MNLTIETEIVDWPETHFVFIEKTGPFMKTAPAAWTEAHPLAPELSQNNQITGYITLFKREQQIYRAGFALAAAPVQPPEGLAYELFPGGKYSRFVLTGPFSNLGPAWGRVFQIVAEKGIEMRDDFCIEHYVTDPRVTPEDQLVTHILIPTK